MMPLLSGLLLAALSVTAAPISSLAQDAPVEPPKPAPAEGDKPAPVPARPIRPPQPTFEIKGKVMLPDGSPAVGATVAQQFDLSSGEPKVARGAAITVNDDGTFAATQAAAPDFPLVVYSADGKHAGWVFTNRDDAAKGVEIKLSPVVEMSGSLLFPAKGEEKRPVDNYSVVLNHPYANAQGRNMMAPVIAMNVQSADGFKASIPAGTYTMLANPARGAKMPEGVWQYDLAGNSRKVEVKAGEPLSLGEMELKFTRLGSLKGQVFPEWKVSEAKNTDGKNQIADYRGKWVLVEFWGHW